MRRTAFLLFVVLSSQPMLSADDAGARSLRVERWLKAVLHHVPDAADAAALEVSAWSNSDLAALRIDETVLLQLMRDPRRSSFQQAAKESLHEDIQSCVNCSVSESQGPRKIQVPQPIRYTSLDLHRLKVLACAAAGTLTSPVCLELKAAKEIDADLTTLAALAAAARDRGDGNYVLRRGALLHTDAAMLDADRISPLNAGGSDEPVRVHIVDGEPAGIGAGEVHWEIARLLLDGIRPGHDAMVSLWYRATAAWMQSHTQYNNIHLDHARQLFPDDADIAFLSGCERETDAGPAMQSVARAAALPYGVTLGIAPERTALKDAEAFFRRALALNPSMVEARVRLGHVLLARGKAQDAAAELRPAVATTADRQLHYFGAMFLGAAEETLGHLDAAGEAYTQASARYPDAQSPYLALSALAARRGDRAGAFGAVRQVFDVTGTASNGGDPWWDYHVTQARNADALLAELRRPFLEAQR